MKQAYLNILAQNVLQAAIERIAGVVSTVTIPLFFGATILAGIMVTMGRTEFLKEQRARWACLRTRKPSPDG